MNRSPRPRVLVVGGTGAFGSRLVGAIAAGQEFDLVIAALCDSDNRTSIPQTHRSQFRPRRGKVPAACRQKRTTAARRIGQAPTAPS
jgi:FlaA1/EpsC-like NDP-sugar epimerase